MVVRYRSQTGHVPDLKRASRLACTHMSTRSPRRSGPPHIGASERAEPIMMMVFKGEASGAEGGGSEGGAEAAMLCDWAVFSICAAAPRQLC